MNKTNKKGFTLAELLIVVAIIAVLVAIAIPVFTSQLEKAREAVDAANLRAAYAEVLSDVLTGDGTKTIEVKQTQKKAGWYTTFEFPKDFTPITAPDGAENKKWTVQYVAPTTVGTNGTVKAELGA